MSEQILFGTNDFAINPDPRLPCILPLGFSHHGWGACRRMAAGSRADPTGRGRESLQFLRGRCRGGEFRDSGTNLGKRERASTSDRLAIPRAVQVAFRFAILRLALHA